MKAIDSLAAILVIVGALNWGLIGAFNFNLVQSLFGDSALATIVYILVGVSALTVISLWLARQRRPSLAAA